MHVPDNLTIFQSLLPLSLLQQEFVDVWLKTPVFARTLERLRSATLITVPFAEVAELCV